MYTSEVIWLLVWPVFIAIAYVLVVMAIKRFEKKQGA